MKVLNVINSDDIWKELTDFGEKNQISEDDIICSIVYEFADKLPYSMDYMDKDFVPGLFLNISPVNPSKSIFKDYNSLYYKMLNWADTKKSGIVLQICNIFQEMLMDQFPSNYQLTNEDFYNLGFDKLTIDKKYNQFLFETLQILPEYCNKLNSTKNVTERRKILDDIYMKILNRVGPKIGNFRRTSVDDDIINVQKYKSSINLFPHKDLAMLYYFERIRYDFQVRNLVDNINKKIFIGINQKNENNCLELKIKVLKK